MEKSMDLTFLWALNKIPPVKTLRTYPNVLWTHTADMYASKVLEV